jgi:hypothetical protein
MYRNPSQVPSNTQFHFQIYIFFLATSTRQYEVGTTYNYHYTAAVLLNEAPPLFSQNSTNKTKGTDVGYQVKTINNF